MRQDEATSTAENGTGSRTRVMLLFGGRSSEHAISCATAAGILGAIDRDRFEVVPVGITRDGAWVLEDDDPAKHRLDPERMPEVRDNGTRVRMPDTIDSRSIRVEEQGAEGALASRDLGPIDVVFPVLHGPFGEDGTVQGVLELAGIPFVGSSVLASAVGMDKHFAKLVLRDAGLRVADGVTLAEDRWLREPAIVRAELVEALGFPMFAKPARAGSSVGVAKIRDESELDAGLETAFREDERVLVERAVVGREVEIAILDARPGERARASVPGEIRLTGAEFYDFATKYLDAPGVALDCPAQMTPAQREEMAELGIRAFEALDARGLARVDFFLAEDGFIVNEVNTMPGFTPISMFPRCWQESGLAYPELIAELLDVALARAAERDSRAARLAGGAV